MLIRQTRLAVRSFMKRPLHSFINGFGLAVGLGCFALITLFVQDELSYDTHHADADRVYRVTFLGQPPTGGEDRFAVVSSPVGLTIRNDVPGVESVVRLAGFGAKVLKDGQYFFDDRMWYAEPELFDIFTLPVVEGPQDGHLERPGTMVITESASEKYFGRSSAVGQTLVLNDSLNYEVTAVIEDMPRTSHIEADMFISYATRLQHVPEDNAWLNLGLLTYIKTTPNVDFPALEERIHGLPHEYFGEPLDQFGFKAFLNLEPLSDIYLRSDLDAGIGPTGDMTQVWVFSAVGIFILLLAGINFTNLATARSMERAREVGVRKAIGSSRGSLIAQFVGESVVLSTMSLVLGLLLAAGALGVLNDIASKSLSRADLLAPDLLGVLVLAALGSGVLGALYPAFLLSGFNPVDVLKGSNHSTRTGAFVRKSLVALQFAISIGLIAGTIVVRQQLDYMQNRALGFDKEQMLVLDVQTTPRNDLHPRVESVLDQFQSLSQVQQASFSANIPGRGAGRLLFLTEDLAEDDIRSAANLNVGYDFFENYGIELVAGRTFSRDYTTDLDDALIINEELVRYVGWSSPEDALGKEFTLGGSGRRVIGVVADYHHQSLKTAIQPTMIFPTDRVNNFLSLRVAGQDAQAAVEAATSLWTTLFPAYAAQSFFLDDDFNRQYQQEIRLRNVFSIFAGLAIFIACLGLFGLASFTAQQRTKEIGIRKVLGASVGSLVTLLSREFAVLVGVGLVLSIPATVYGLAQWLEPFPYRIDIAWWVFVIAGVSALVIALLTVGWQARRTATADPVESLRYE